MRFEKVSQDSNDVESDSQSLLEHDLDLKIVRLQKKRHWTFLAVNTFVLLLNIGILLMISAPKAVEEGFKPILYPRFPHEGWFTL